MVSAKKPPIVAGGHADQAAEHAPERGGVLVPDRPGDLVDRALGELQQLARLLEASTAPRACCALSQRAKGTASSAVTGPDSRPGVTTMSAALSAPGRESKPRPKPPASSCDQWLRRKVRPPRAAEKSLAVISMSVRPWTMAD